MRCIPLPGTFHRAEAYNPAFAGEMPKEEKEEYCGWKKVIPTEKELAEFNSYMKENNSNALVNSLLFIFFTTFLF